MKNVFESVILRTIKKSLKKRKPQLTKQLLDEEVNFVKIEFSHFVHDLFLMTLVILSAAFGFKGFLLLNAFIYRGCKGISLIIAEYADFPFSVLLVLINLPFLILGFHTIGKKFAFQSIIALVLLAVSVQFIPFRIITDDKLLIAVFGSFFLGLGIGLAMRGESVIDGTEVLAIYKQKK